MNKFFGFLKNLLSLLSFLFFTLFSISTVSAQNVSVKQFPDSPREGEEVKLTLESDKYDLNIATVTWTVDGEEVDSGVGRKTLSIKASSNGLAQIILAKVEQEGFDPDQIQKVVEANTNFILYEGVDSYVPSFYKGRRLPTKEGTARAAFFSFKDGAIVGLTNSSTDTYSWKVNGEENAALSGQNKIINNIQSKVTDNVLSLRISKLDSKQNIKVAEATVPLQKTETIVYKTDEKKLLRQVLNDTEVGKKIFLLVEPFFFSVADKKDSKLLYDWKVNDVETKIATPWAVVFSGKERDSVRINLKLINNQKITQENSRGFTFKVE
jgi:hypothetical protein